jgi:hypothetical protein
VVALTACESDANDSVADAVKDVETDVDIDTSKDLDADALLVEDTVGVQLSVADRVTSVEGLRESYDIVLSREDVGDLVDDTRWRVTLTPWTVND